MSVIDKLGDLKSTDRLAAAFAVASDSPRLIQSQIKALSRRIPLLYFIVIVNTVAVACTHYGVAPDILTIGFPILVALAGFMRGGPG